MARPSLPCDLRQVCGGYLESLRAVLGLYKIEILCKAVIHTHMHAHVHTPQSVKHEILVATILRGINRRVLSQV